MVLCVSCVLVGRGFSVEGHFFIGEWSSRKICKLANFWINVTKHKLLFQWRSAWRMKRNQWPTVALDFDWLISSHAVPFDLEKSFIL